jgi:aminoglycoside/choline kinase family phosphotransferase
MREERQELRNGRKGREERAQGKTSVPSPRRRTSIILRADDERASAVTDSRAGQAHRWAESQLALSGTAFAPASADASFRRYFRLTSGERSWIVMDAPPERENCGPFVAVARLLRRWGLNAPEILAEDPRGGYLLLSDLGTQTFLNVLTDHNADALFAAATAALLQMQAAAAREPDALAQLPPYDATLLWREARLFSEWYLPKHLQVTLAADEATELERVLGVLVRAALAQPRTFVHRDYMPRNLMVSKPNPGILDFQDAVVGPIAYDALCLFKDAFRSWPEERVAGWLFAYWDGARTAGLPVPATFAEFQRLADWIGLHRHLKVMGIFARLTYRDGKPQYVADTPRFARYVMAVAPKYPELAPLVALFERHVLPVVPA